MSHRRNEAVFHPEKDCVSREAVVPPYRLEP
jgi:hypothetical protein